MYDDNGIGTVIAVRIRRFGEKTSRFGLLSVGSEELRPATAEEHAASFLSWNIKA